VLTLNSPRHPAQVQFRFLVTFQSQSIPPTLGTGSGSWCMELAPRSTAVDSHVLRPYGACSFRSCESCAISHYFSTRTCSWVRQSVLCEQVVNDGRQLMTLWWPLSTWCASPEETTNGRERGGGWSSPYYIRVAKNTPSYLLVQNLVHQICRLLAYDLQAKFLVSAEYSSKQLKTTQFEEALHSNHLDEYYVDETYHNISKLVAAHIINAAFRSSKY